MSCSTRGDDSDDDDDNDELLNTSHTNILLLKQLFSQAEKWHLNLDTDMSELENRYAGLSLVSTDNTGLSLVNSGTSLTLSRSGRSRNSLARR